MAKTFAPQFVVMLKRLVLYATKHRAAMNTVMTSPQQSAVDAIVAAYSAFAGYDPREEV